MSKITINDLIKELYDARQTAKENGPQPIQVIVNVKNARKAERIAEY